MIFGLQQLRKRYSIRSEATQKGISVSSLMRQILREKFSGEIGAREEPRAAAENNNVDDTQSRP
jgi:hypothetical protein